MWRVSVHLRMIYVSDAFLFYDKTPRQNASEAYFSFLLSSPKIHCGRECAVAGVRLAWQPGSREFTFHSCTRSRENREWILAVKSQSQIPPTFPVARLHSLKVPSPLQTASPTGHQVVKRMGPWGTFLIQTTTLHIIIQICETEKCVIYHYYHIFISKAYSSKKLKK